MRLAEVAPAAPVAVEALTGLLILTGLIVALGLIKFVVAFINFNIWLIRKTIGHIPFAGGAIEGLAKRGAQKLTNALGEAEREVDSAVAWTWHNLAFLIRWTVREIERLSYGLLVAALATQLHISRRQAARLIQAFLHPLRTLQLLERKLLHALRHGLVVTSHAVGGYVLPRLGRAEAELDHVIEWDIPRLRARERALERRVERLWKWVRAHEKIVVSTAFVGAVAVALGRLGGGWIRCRNPRKVGKWLCGLPPNLIEDLLGLAIAFGVLIDPEETAHLALVAEQAIEPLVRRMLSAPAGMEDEAVAALEGLLG